MAGAGGASGLGALRQSRAALPARDRRCLAPRCLGLLRCERLLSAEAVVAGSVATEVSWWAQYGEQGALKDDGRSGEVAVPVRRRRDDLEERWASAGVGPSFLRDPAERLEEAPHISGGSELGQHPQFVVARVPPRVRPTGLDCEAAANAEHVVVLSDLDRGLALEHLEALVLVAVEVTWRTDCVDRNLFFDPKYTRLAGVKDDPFSGDWVLQDLCWHRRAPSFRALLSAGRISESGLSVQGVIWFRMPRIREPAPPDRAAAGDEEMLATAAVLAIFKASTRLLEELQPVFTDHDTTVSRFDVLEALSRRAGPTRPAELREMLHLPAQTLTGLLDQLESASLVRRSPNPADRRSILVELTEQGKAIVERICPPLIEIERDCMVTLSAAEQRQLVALLAKVDARITQRRAAGA